MQDTNESGQRARHGDWKRDDPTVGSPWDPDQASIAARWDVRSFWKKLAHESGLSENAAMIGFELYHEALNGNRWTSYSRTDEHYASHPKSALYTKRRIVGGVDELDATDLVWNWKQVRDGRDWQSACKAKPALVAMIGEIVEAGGRPYPARPRTELLLRDADGKPIAIRETAETRRMTMELHDYNNLMRTADVSGGRASCVRRVFNGTLKHGGRHYCLGLGFQRMPSWQRALLTIGGAKVGEFDFGSLHPCLMYAMAGLPIPDDAYDLAWWDRDLQKVGFLVVVNAEDRDQALHSIASKPQMAKVAEPGSVEALRVATALYDELEDRHRAIADMFSSSVGRILQRRDSDMMAAILREMTQAKRLALPVFDSCIVAESDVDLLREVMRKVADKAGLDGIRIEKVVPKAPDPEKADFVEFPAILGTAGETSRLMPSPFLPSSSSSLPPLFQDMAQESDAASRRGEAEAPHQEPAGRPFLPTRLPSFQSSDSSRASSMPTSVSISDSASDPDTVFNALTSEFRSPLSEDPSASEHPLKSPQDRSQTPSALVPAPSLPETADMPLNPAFASRAVVERVLAVRAACRLVHGPGCRPRMCASTPIRRDSGPGVRTTLLTPDDAVDVWAPPSGPVLVRMARRGWDNATTVVAPSPEDGLAMAAEYLHDMRADGGTGDLAVRVLRYPRYDPVLDSAANRRGRTELSISMPRPQPRDTFAPIPEGAMAPDPVVVGRTAASGGVADLAASFETSIADLPHGAARSISRPKKPVPA